MFCVLRSNILKSLFLTQPIEPTQPVNGIGDKGAAALAPSLAHLTQLTHLDLSGELLFEFVSKGLECESYRFCLEQSTKALVDDPTRS